MAQWAGFSDDDLRRLKAQSDVKTEHSKPPPKKATIRPQKAVVRPRQQRPAPSTTQSQSVEPVTSDMRLSQVKANPVFSADDTNPEESMVDHSDHEGGRTVVIGSGLAKEKDGNPEVVTAKEDGGQPENMSTELNREQAIEREKSTLQQFQLKQKMMEELNKKKKDMLVSAIKERKQKASAEASKLNYLQKELAHLDMLLNADVSLLRDKIEDAARDYTEAQKRYDRAEKEFIEAKMELHKTADFKEQLTEHLYSIIHQNEVRKAKKLAELMDKLEMEFSMETMDMDIPQVPQLSIFNSVPDIHPGETGPRSPGLEKRKLLLESQLQKQHEEVSATPMTSDEQEHQLTASGEEKHDENTNTS